MSDSNAFFHNLSPAELERLAMLAEEAAEVIQAVTKIVRHGYECHHPDEPGVNNRDNLKRELTDLFAVLGMMEYGQDLDLPSQDEIVEAIRRKFQYTHHQERPE